MILIKLLLVFAKIGLFSFGGGYAMIPMIQREIELNGWLSASEFIDIIAISEMTPGPIAINAATFVGYNASGILGSAMATLGVAIPSFFLTLIVTRFFYKFRDSSITKAVLYGIRPVIAALVLIAALNIAEASIFNTSILNALITNKELSGVLKQLLGSITILAVSLIALIKYKINPIIVIICSGAAGAIIFHIL